MPVLLMQTFVHCRYACHLYSPEISVIFKALKMPPPLLHQPPHANFVGSHPPPQSTPTQTYIYVTLEEDEVPSSSSSSPSVLEIVIIVAVVFGCLGICAAGADEKKKERLVAVWVRT